VPVVYFRKEATPTPEQRSWRARIARNEKPLIAAFLAWVDRLHEQLTDNVLANAIIHRSAGMLDHILQAVAFQPVLYPVAVDEAVRAFDDIANRLDPQLHLSFNLHNPHFDRMVQAEQARLVREVTTETRRAIANVVSRGYASGVHPYVLAPQISQEMIDRKLTKTDMARRMKTSRAALDRLLDPENDAVTLNTLSKAATAVGRQLHFELI